MLELAEAKRAKDRRYNAVRFRRELTGEAGVPALVALLRKLGRARRVDRVAALIDLADIDAAAAVLEKLRAAVADARRAA